MVGKVKTARRDAPLSVISLFTGLGGMDYGLEAAGFETRVAVEMNKHAVDALRSWREMEPSTRRLICHWHQWQLV